MTDRIYKTAAELLPEEEDPVDWIAETSDGKPFAMYRQVSLWGAGIVLICIKEPSRRIEVRVDPSLGYIFI